MSFQNNNNNNNNNFSVAEIKASHEEIRRATVDGIKQSILRFEKSEISLAGTSNFQGLSQRGFGGVSGSNAAAVMGQWRTFVDEYGAQNCCPPSFVPGRNKKWPLPIADALQGITVRAKCGVFPQISRVFVVVDNKIILWHYGTDDLTQVQPFPETIVAVHLAEPRKNVFMSTIQQVLVVTTPSELHFVGLSSHDGGDLNSSDLVPLEMSDYTLTKTPSTLTCITSHRRTGRIFCGGSDGFVYEVLYSNADSILRARMSLANRSIYFGGTAVVNSVGRAIASFRQTWVRPNSPIIDVICSDDRSGTMFALSENGRIETWTVEEEDIFSASSIVSSATTAEEEAPSDAGSITFQCSVEHDKALKAYLEEPGRRQALNANTGNVVGDGGATGSQQGTSSVNGAINPDGSNQPQVIPLISLHLPARGVSGFSTSSSSSSSTSTGTVIAVDASGARYYYNASASFSMYAYGQTLEMKLTRREAPLRFADGAETGSRNLRCCAVGGETGGGFIAVYENGNNGRNNAGGSDDVITLAGPNLLPFNGAQSPNEVVSMFTHQPMSNNNNNNNSNNFVAAASFPTTAQITGGSSSRVTSIKVMAVADCSTTAATEAGRFRRQFIVIHNEGISFISSLRPLDILHCALLAPARIQRVLFQRIQAVASPADVAYLLIQLLTQQQQQTGTAKGNSELSNFRTTIFKGTTLSASAPASPEQNAPQVRGGQQQQQQQQSQNLNNNNPYRNLDEGKCATFEVALLDRLVNHNGIAAQNELQVAFELLRTLAHPMSMSDSHSATESNLTVIFSPLSGGLTSAIGQAIMSIYKNSPTIVASQGTSGDKAKFAKNLASAARQLQAILDLMDRMKVNNNNVNNGQAQQQQHGSNTSTPHLTGAQHQQQSVSNNNNSNAVWSPIANDTIIFIDPSIQVSYDDSAVNMNHARSCGSASLRVVLNQNNNNNSNNNNNNNNNNHGFTLLSAQHGHRLHHARLAYLHKICDFARQVVYFWKRATESVAPSIVNQVSLRLGNTNPTVLEMIYRKAEAAVASRTLIRVLLAEERNALVPNVAVWNELLADFERSCPELYNVSDSLESRATLDIQRLVRAGTEQFADRSGTDLTLQTLAQQSNTMWKAGSLEPIVWQLHKSGCSVDAVVLLLRAAARLDSTRTNQSAILAIRAVTEGHMEAGATAPDSFKDKLRCLDCLHAVLEDLRRLDETTFDLFFDSTRTGLNAPPGWCVWEVENADRVAHMSILAWLAAPRDDRTVSRKLRNHVTGVYGGRSQGVASPFLRDYFELQSKVNVNNNGGVQNSNQQGGASSSTTSSSAFPNISVETARFQWHTRRNHANAVTTFMAVSQSEMLNRPIEERLQARLDVLREAKQCAREGGLDVAQIDRTIRSLTNQKKLLEDIEMLQSSPSGSTNTERFNEHVNRLATVVVDTEELFRIANRLPNGAGFDVQLIVLESNAIDDSQMYSDVIDRAFASKSMYNPIDAARICLQHVRAAVFPLDVVIMYVESYLAWKSSSVSSSSNNNNNNSSIIGTNNWLNNFNLRGGNNNNSSIVASGNTSSSYSSGVDLLNDAGVSSRRIFDEYLKLVKYLHNKGVGITTTSRVATEHFNDNCSVIQMVGAATEAMKRHVVIARPSPSKQEVKEWIDTLRKILVTAVKGKAAANQQPSSVDVKTAHVAEQALNIIAATFGAE